MVHCRWERYVVTCIVALGMAVASQATRAEDPKPPGDADRIRAALRKPITMSLERTPWGDVVEMVRKSAAINVLLDQQALDEIGVGPDAPVTLNVRDMMLASALKHVLHQIDPTITSAVRDEVLLITTFENEQESLERKLFDIADLVADNLRDSVSVIRAGESAPRHDGLEWVQELITSSIEPDSWNEVGGSGTIVIFDRLLYVQNYGTVIDEVGDLLETLRAMRAQLKTPPTQWKAMPAKPSWQRAVDQRFSKALDARIKIVEFEETPLHEVASFLSSDSEIPILLDQKALDEVGIGPDVLVTLHLKDASLRTVLYWGLRSIDPTLTFVVRDEVLMITTRESAEENLLVVLYPVADLVGAKGEKYDAWIRLINKLVEPDSWDYEGGPGSALACPASGCIVIAQTDEIHQSIERLLVDVRKQKAEQPRAEPADAPKSRDADPVGTFVYILADVRTTAE
ncbi:MAG: hypothetical protein O3B95_12845, partial [Chloroflexi bacterium]|nr:hypothetical protein [Chloroflexota bacterium]